MSITRKKTRFYMRFQKPLWWIKDDVLKAPVDLLEDFIYMKYLWPFLSTENELEKPA